MFRNHQIKCYSEVALSQPNPHLNLTLDPNPNPNPNPSPTPNPDPSASPSPNPNRNEVAHAMGDYVFTDATTGAEVQPYS